MRSGSVCGTGSWLPVHAGEGDAPRLAASMMSCSAGLQLSIRDARKHSKQGFITWLSDFCSAQLVKQSMNMCCFSCNSGSGTAAS